MTNSSACLGIFLANLSSPISYIKACLLSLCKAGAHHWLCWLWLCPFSFPSYSSFRTQADETQHEWAGLKEEEKRWLIVCQGPTTILDTKYSKEGGGKAREITGAADYAGSTGQDFRCESWSYVSVGWGLAGRREGHRLSLQVGFRQHYVQQVINLPLRSLFFFPGHAARLTRDQTRGLGSESTES